jgi:hypothetical protein
MKKLFFAMFIVASVLSFSSCKKTNSHQGQFTTDLTQKKIISKIQSQSPWSISRKTNLR